MSVGADKGYEVRTFIEGVRALGVTPHVAGKRSHSAVHRRTIRHAGYALSLRRRKVIEEGFGLPIELNNRPRKRLARKTSAEASDELLSEPFNPPRWCVTG